MIQHFYVKFVILSASVFEISCGKTDSRGLRWKPYQHDYRRRV